MTHPSSSVKPGEHKWTGVRAGGDPANAYSYEYVRYCELCGMEDTCEDPLPPCAGAPGEQRGETLFAGLEPVPDGAETYSDFVEARPLPARPEKIERWDLQEDKLGKFMEIVPNGEFVRWHQYAALEAKLSRQESAEDAWRRAMKIAERVSGYNYDLVHLFPYAPPISPDKEGQ